MKHRLITIPIALLTVFHLMAQTNSLLWEFSKPGYESSYLFGSIHLGTKEILDLGLSALPYLQECDAYAGEIILEPKDMFKLLPLLYEKDKTKTCSQLLDSLEYFETKTKVIEVLGSEFVLLLPSISPYMLATLLSLSKEDLELNSGQFLDLYLQEEAGKNKMDLISLESIASQMAYLQNIDTKAQKEYLLQIVRETKMENQSISDLVQLYLDQNLSAIEQSLFLEEQDDPLITRAFIEDRNLLQLEGILKTCSQQKTFIAVGLAHLVGAKGLLHLLEQEGFSLKPIP
ncbi:MAG: TraB/GumN family protein, partial [Chitinophagales bacterium]|nr:TraB/GumN family protein [Chitinophagales bacterium]